MSQVGCELPTLTISFSIGSTNTYSVVKQMRFNVDEDETSMYLVETASFPSTRYQGSKRKLIDWLWSRLETVEFDSILDAFGGTGVVSHRAKRHGKRTIYNDLLTYNYHIGQSIIENDSRRLQDEEVEFIDTTADDVTYPSVVQEEFEDIYFTDSENEWLDVAQYNIQELDNTYAQSLALAAIGQSCLAKRPYNLFHRANLHMRLEDVERSFGNKQTWDTPFIEHFEQKVDEFNDAVFDNERQNKAYCRNVLEWDNPPETDLVYLDPPYYDSENGGTDYQFYYHFLEGYVNYDDWQDRIDRSVQTKRLKQDDDVPWLDKQKVYDAFERMFELFSDRAIALSYNSSGLPTPEELVEMLSQHKKEVNVYSQSHQYALSSDNSEELLFIAKDD